MPDSGSARPGYRCARAPAPDACPRGCVAGTPRRPARRCRGGWRPDAMPWPAAAPARSPPPGCARGRGSGAGGMCDTGTAVGMRRAERDVGDEVVDVVPEAGDAGGQRAPTLVDAGVAAGQALGAERVLGG